jgi:two-component system, chemotaxis family, protein-glutamate methylesterase/glutaminase
MNKYKIDIPYKAIVIGGSAGSFQGIVKILSHLPDDFELPIIMCLHRLKHVRNGFVEALSIKSVKPIEEPHDKQGIKKRKVYLAPANYHMMIELGNTFALSTDEMVNNSRPSIDITFSTAAYVYKSKLVCILLSGANRDGAWGVKKVKEWGGLTIVQDPKECLMSTMPNAAIEMSEINYILTIDEIIRFLKDLHQQNK